MFADQQPTNMRKEESTGGIVWIGIGFAVFVVHTMITRPFVNVVLREEKTETKQKGSLIQSNTVDILIQLKIITKQ